MEHYVPVGQEWVFDIGPARILHRYISDREMHYRILSGEFAGVEETVAIQVKSLGDKKFLVSWQEGNKTTVVHWEDFAHNRFESFATLPDHLFLHFSGRMAPQT